jgi:mannose-6-phosphate isomerase-like protein (cupin superfamily)
MRAGQSISNRHTGETLTMLISEEETHGTRQLYQVYLPPHRPSPPMHYHLDFTETFSVIEGQLDLHFGRQRKHVILNAGESLTAQIRQPHTFANERDSPALIMIDTQPAAGVVRAFQLAYGVANDRGASRDGLPKNPLIRLLFVRMTQGFLPGIPLFLERAVLNAAAAVAKFSGPQARLQKYF